MKYKKFSETVELCFQATDCRPKREPQFSAIVIHHTSGSADTEAGWVSLAKGVTRWLLLQDKNYVSAHFQINRDGTIVQICDPKLYEAFHAGKSERWHQGQRKVVTDWNRWAVGIELVGDGNLGFYSPEQYRSLISLCKDLMTSFPISIKDVVGHDEIAPGRKEDPGKNFDWDNFIRCLASDLSHAGTVLD